MYKAHQLIHQAQEFCELSLRKKSSAISQIQDNFVALDLVVQEIWLSYKLWGIEPDVELVSYQNSSTHR